jgi:hypothetical protein
MMTDSGISYQQMENFNTLPFWKKNESFLRELERAELPSKTRLIAKDISNSKNPSGEGNLVTNYDLINIYDNRKHFFSIAAELDPNRSSVVKVEIVAGNKLSNPKKTVVDGSRITNKAYIEWLKEMSRNDVYKLFRV